MDLYILFRGRAVKPRAPVTASPWRSPGDRSGEPAKHRNRTRPGVTIEQGERMIVLTNQGQILARLCAALGQWGMVLSLPDWSDPLIHADEGAERMRAMLPDELTADQTTGIMFENGGFVLGSEEEIRRLYRATHGDDGPHHGAPCAVRDFHVYALTCNDRGELQNENT